LLSACKEKAITVVLDIGESEQYHPNKYSEMANDPASRDKFVSSVMEIINKYSGLGGLLISWVYPVFHHVSIQKALLFNHEYVYIFSISPLHFWIP
jgi:GH18 family chitinase